MNSCFVRFFVLFVLRVSRLTCYCNVIVRRNRKNYRTALRNRDTVLMQTFEYNTYAHHQLDVQLALAPYGIGCTFELLRLPPRWRGCHSAGQQSTGLPRA